MFNQLTNNELKTTNGGFIVPVAVWAFSYDAGRRNARNRQNEQRRQEEKRIAENYQAGKALINGQHAELNEQEALLDALDHHWAVQNNIH